MKSEQETVTGWFAGRLPDGWFVGPPAVTADQDEILVVGELAEPDVGDDATDASRGAARAARIKRFREETRDQRVRIADEAQHLWGRTVSWGARCGDEERLFTTLSTPVMTRLRMPERTVLDTLIEGGVARSRSEALAWCVRLVARNEDAWLAELRDALTRVRDVRAEGPASA